MNFRKESSLEHKREIYTTFRKLLCFFTREERSPPTVFGRFSYHGLRAHCFILEEAKRTGLRNVIYFV